MARVQTNFVSFAVTDEQEDGTLSSPQWRDVETNPDGLQYGASLTKVRRAPLSPDRSARKGVTTSLEAPYAFTTDLTMDAVYEWLPAFIYSPSTLNGTTRRGANASTTGYDAGVPTELEDLYQSGGNGDALIFARGYSNAQNNGLKAITGTVVNGRIPIGGDVLVAETASDNAAVYFAGFQTAAGDVDFAEFDADARTAALTSTNLDFETLGLTEGQFIHIGGLTAANRFPSGEFGLARVVSIGGNRLGLDKLDDGFTQNSASAGSGPGSEIHLLYGHFYRNVEVTDDEFHRPRLRFEVTEVDLGGTETNPVPMYSYATGVVPNSISLNMTPAELITVSLAFLGRDHTVPVLEAARAAGADSPLEPLANEGLNSTDDISRLRVEGADASGLSSEFKSLNFTINNNLEGEATLAHLGPRFLNSGNLEVVGDAVVVLDNPGVIRAIRDNETVTMDFALRNAEGGMVVDIDEATLEGGGRNFAVNASVDLSVQIVAHRSARFGTVVSFSTFPVLPALNAG